MTSTPASLRKNLMSKLFESLFSVPEIVAVAEEGVASKSKNDQLSADVLEATLTAAKAADEPVRLITSYFTVNTFRLEDNRYIAVAYPTGHQIAKSLGRMVRRRVKNPRVPAPERATPKTAPASGVTSW